MPAKRKVDREEFARLHATGMWQIHLAEHFGISRSTVIAISKELDLKRPRRQRRKISRKVDRDAVMGLHNEGLTAAEIAERMECSEYTITRIRKELGLNIMRPMTPERRANIQRMLDDAWSWKEIERTEGANWDTMRRHFPGTAWTHTHVGHMNAAISDIRPRMTGRNSNRRKAA